MTAKQYVLWYPHHEPCPGRGSSSMEKMSVMLVFQRTILTYSPPFGGPVRRSTAQGDLHKVRWLVPQPLLCQGPARERLVRPRHERAPYALWGPWGDASRCSSACRKEEKGDRKIGDMGQERRVFMCASFLRRP